MTRNKKLIEVALPLDAINKACKDDKDRKTGHIRNLHKWYAPMPLPAWRAALFASIIDDPSVSSFRPSEHRFPLLPGVHSGRNNEGQHFADMKCLPERRSRQFCRSRNERRR
jgi:adenine-specific DNA methylase